MVEEWINCFEIELHLLATESGGLRGSMPIGTPSLIWVFDPDGERAQFGGKVVSASAALEPGQAVTASVVFLSDTVHLHATPGAEVEVWYGRSVGRGRVLGPCPPRVIA